MKKGIITKCFNCNFIDIIGNKRCKLCKGINYNWNGKFNFDKLNDHYRRNIVKINMVAYENHYNRKKGYLKILTDKDKKIFIVIKEKGYIEKPIKFYDERKKKWVKRVPQDFFELQCLPDTIKQQVITYILYDKTAKYLPKKVKLDNEIGNNEIYSTKEFETEKELKLFLLHNIINETIFNKLFEGFYNRINIQQGKESGSIDITENILKQSFLSTEKKILKSDYENKLLNYIHLEVIDNFLMPKLKSKMLGELEFSKLRNEITEKEYYEVFNKICFVNDLITNYITSNEEFEKEKNRLFEYVRSLDGQEIEI